MKGRAIQNKVLSVLVFVPLFMIACILSFALSLVSATPTHAEAKKSTLTLGVSTDTLSLDLLPSANGTFGDSGNEL